MVRGLSLDLPEQLYAAWRQAAPARVSRRTYTPQPVPPDALAILEQVCRLLPAQHRARVVPVPDVSQEVFTGAVRSYGRVLSPPSALFMVGLTDPAFVEAVGYVGEAAVLEATRLGLNTCWVGGFFDYARAISHVALRPGERVWAVSPLGYATTALRPSERVAKALARSRKRKAAAALAPGEDLATWPRWAREAVELARLAPSAVNRQPWRFAWTGGTVEISQDAFSRGYGIPKRLDCGIAMLHFELAALGAGVRGHWEHMGGERVARFRRTGADPEVSQVN